MRTPAHSMISLLAVATLASSVALAQDASPPARETPRPQDIDPAVNTSDTAGTPARETPRPQDLDPAVDTSSPSQTPGAASAPATDAASSSTPPAQAGARNATAGAASQAPAGAQGQAQAGKPGTRRGMDRLELDTTQITGNRELPKVLYIVPWKRSDLGDLVGKPVNSLLDEVLAPVDRDVFKRENRYYRALSPGNDEGAGAPLGPNAPGYRPPGYGSVPAAGSAGSAEKSSTGSGSSAPPAGNER